MSEDYFDPYPPWSRADIEAMIGLRFRYRGASDWIAIAPAKLGGAIIIRNSEGALAGLGPVTVGMGKAVLLSARPVRKGPRALWPHERGRAALADINMALRRLSLFS